MNIFLIPYTWLRHLSMPIWCGGAGLLSWWGILGIFVLAGPSWSPSWDGFILMGATAGGIGTASIFGEGNLRRRAITSRIWRILLTFALTVALTIVFCLLWNLVTGIVFSGDRSDDAGDATLVSLTYRIGAFVGGGLASGLGPLVVRKGKGWLNHLCGGVACGLAAAAVWHTCGLYFPADLYIAGAAMAMTWGVFHGLFIWGIPDELYAGWIRVLSRSRFGLRIPIDAPDRIAKERFIGHFPRGLDQFLPMEEQVSELHISIAVDEKQRYAARGLSLAPTLVKRFLERIDIRYDPRRPAPLETEITSGDRIRLGEGSQVAEVEFLMLPREEQ